MSYRPRRQYGYVVYLLLCSDNSTFCGMSKDFKRDIAQIRIGVLHSRFLRKRMPVRVVFKEERLPFKEARAKYKYLRYMNRRCRDKLIKNQQWYFGKVLLRLYDKYGVPTDIEEDER